MFHAKGAVGPIDLDDYWTRDRGFSKAQGVVLDLIIQECNSTGLDHVIWLDIMFTWACLLTELADEGFDGAGTVSTTTTQRGKDEQRSGTEAQRKKIPKEQNRGLQRCLSELKTEHNLQIPWGSLYGALSEDERVLEFAWKDRNVVLFMTTIHTGREMVTRLRRRPAIIATFHVQAGWRLAMKL